MFIGSRRRLMAVKAPVMHPKLKGDTRRCDKVETSGICNKIKENMVNGVYLLVAWGSGCVTT